MVDKFGWKTRELTTCHSSRSAGLEGVVAVVYRSGSLSSESSGYVVRAMRV
jgi:hypothetical protein